MVNNSLNQSPPRPPSVGVRPYSTAGGRELRLAARPPARFSSLPSPQSVNQKQEPSGNTLLAQRYPLSGNSYFWRTAVRRFMAREPTLCAPARGDYDCYREFLPDEEE